MLIGFTGKAKSGKDTSYLVLKESGFKAKRYALADELKRIVQKYFGFSDKEMEEKGPVVRRTLQAVGVMFREEVNSKFWVEKLDKIIWREEMLDHPTKYHSIVTDIRFPNEASWIKQRQGHLIKIERKHAGLSGKASKHISEKPIPKHLIDFVVKNNSSKEELCQKLRQVIARLEK